MTDPAVSRALRDKVKTIPENVECRVNAVAMELVHALMPEKLRDAIAERGEAKANGDVWLRIPVRCDDVHLCRRAVDSLPEGLKRGCGNPHMNSWGDHVTLIWDGDRIPPISESSSPASTSSSSDSSDSRSSRSDSRSSGSRSDSRSSRS